MVRMRMMIMIIMIADDEDHRRKKVRSMAPVLVDQIVCGNPRLTIMCGSLKAMHHE
jgi:hypothetical protein